MKRMSGYERNDIDENVEEQQRKVLSGVFANEKKREPGFRMHLDRVRIECHSV